MKTSFDEIQSILLRLSLKQLEVVSSMTQDLITRIRENQEAKRNPPCRTRTRTRTPSKGLPLFSQEGEEPDEVVMKSISPMSHMGSIEQMERICGVGMGHGMHLLEQHLDKIGEKHGHSFMDVDSEEEF